MEPIAALEQRALAILSASGTESVSVEFKQSWYEKTEGGRKELAKDVTKFVDERWEDLTGGIRLNQNFSPNGLMMIVSPVFSESEGYRLNVPEWIKAAVPVRSPDGSDHSSGRPRIDGVLYRFSGDSAEDIGKYIKIYNNGVIETVECDVFNREEDRPIPGGSLMEILTFSAKQSIELSRRLTGATIYRVDLRMYANEGQQIAFFRDTWSDSRGEVYNSDMSFDPTFVDLSLKEYEVEDFRPLLDQVWRSFGFVECGYFDGGTYAHPK